MQTIIGVGAAASCFLAPHTSVVREFAAVVATGFFAQFWRGVHSLSVRKCDNMPQGICYCLFKVAVSRDFFVVLFFMNQTHLGP